MIDYGTQAGTWSDTYRIRAYEVGPDGTCGMGTLGNLLQETAGHHADHLGLSMERLLEDNLAWVLTRLRVIVQRFPGNGEEVRVVTWPSGLDKATATRDFVLYDGDGAELARATSAWVCFDVSSRQMVPAPPFIGEHYPPTHPERVLEFERRTLPRLKQAEGECPVLAREADLDMNGHVNNVHFMEWVLEGAGVVASAGRLREIDIQFRAESLAGDQLQSRVAVNGTGDATSLLHSLLRTADDSELVRAATVWSLPTTVSG